MKTKKMILNAILIAIGVILHIAAPSIGLPAQPDFAVAMLFIIMVLNKDYKTTIIAGIIMGIFRILRCNPFVEGGVDVVPEKFTIFRNDDK